MLQRNAARKIAAEFFACIEAQEKLAGITSMHRPLPMPGVALSSGIFCTNPQQPPAQLPPPAVKVAAVAAVALATAATTAATVDTTAAAPQSRLPEYVPQAPVAIPSVVGGHGLESPFWCPPLLSKSRLMRTAAHSQVCHISWVPFPPSKCKAKNILLTCFPCVPSLTGPGTPTKRATVVWGCAGTNRYIPDRFRNGALDVGKVRPNHGSFGNRPVWQSNGPVWCYACRGVTGAAMARSSRGTVAAATSRPCTTQQRAAPETAAAGATAASAAATGAAAVSASVFTSTNANANSAKVANAAAAAPAASRLRATAVYAAVAESRATGGPVVALINIFQCR